MITMKNFIMLGSSLASASPNTGDYWRNRNLVLDGVTIFNLNLIPTNDAQASSLSLYSVMNHCSTPFGMFLLVFYLFHKYRPQTSETMDL